MILNVRHTADGDPWRRVSVLYAVGGHIQHLVRDIGLVVYSRAVQLAVGILYQLVHRVDVCALFCGAYVKLHRVGGVVGAGVDVVF